MQKNPIARELESGVDQFLRNYKNDNQVRDGIRTVLAGHLSMHGLGNIHQINAFNSFLFSPNKIIFIDPCTIGTNNVRNDIVLTIDPRYKLKSIQPIEIRSKILLKYSTQRHFFFSQFLQMQQGCGVTLIGQDFEVSTIPFNGIHTSLNGILCKIFKRISVDATYKREL